MHLGYLKTVCAAGLVFATTLPAQAQDYRPWMHNDVPSAWQDGFRGHGVRITVVDQYRGPCSEGYVTGQVECRTHGGWTALLANMTAPNARMIQHRLQDGAVSLGKNRLDVLSLSYGRFTKVRGRRDNSIVAAARKGDAVVVKMAGNFGNDIDRAYLWNGQPTIDYLNRSLAGLPGTIFVGALEQHGTREHRASIAAYSARAGSDPRFQHKFLVVGVPEQAHGLAGTSAAAPVVAGYAAILGSKFRNAQPAEIANQLLRTARRDTIRNYRANVHGMGEASLSRALAPRRIR